MSHLFVRKKNYPRKRVDVICVHECTCAMRTKATCLETIFAATANIIKRFIKKKKKNDCSTVKVKVGVRCMDYFCEFLFDVFRAVPHLRCAIARYRARWITRQLFSRPLLHGTSTGEYFRANHPREFTDSRFASAWGKRTVRSKFLSYNHTKSEPELNTARAVRFLARSSSERKYGEAGSSPRFSSASQRGIF